MPIVDIEFICDEKNTVLPTALELATALGLVFASAPGHTWVRLRKLDASCYAENGPPLQATEWPVFVSVLQAKPKQAAALQAEITAVTQAVARVAGRLPERVHVCYAPAAAGRQAFGGKLVGAE